MSRTSYSRKKS